MGIHPNRSWRLRARGQSFSALLLASASVMLGSGSALAQAHRAYSDGAIYTSGEIVSNGGLNYQCNEGVAAWCSGAAWAYEPGVGTAWQQAWTLVDGTQNAGQDSGGSGNSNAGNNNGDSNPSSDSGTWSSSTVYTQGQQVTFNGKIWEAQWWVQGEEPGSQAWGAWREIGDAPADGDSSPDTPADDPAPNDPTGDDPAGDAPNDPAGDGSAGGDTRVGDSPSDPAGDDPAADDPAGEDPASSYPAYESGTVYQGGAIVSNLGNVYFCNTGITSAWCGGVAWAYEPGAGTAWQDAWSLYTGQSASDGGTVGSGSGEAPSGGSGGSGTDGAPLTMTRSSLEAAEAALTSDPGMQRVMSAVRTLDNEAVEAVAPNLITNPSNVRRVESLMSSADFQYFFPKRAPEYTYRKFLQAVAKFPAFCGDYDDGRDADWICRKSMAIAFAHFAQETGGHAAGWDVAEWRQGLFHVREMGWNEGARGGYNGECNPNVWQGQTWPCGTFEDGSFVSYFGRGAKQLSYNYNYGPFSQAMFGDVRVLLDDPGLVADTWLNLASAIFFFVYPQPPKPSMLHVVDGTWQPNARDIANGLVPGFGVTVNIINGGVECGGSQEKAQVVNRISYYRSFADAFGIDVPEDEVLGCAGMQQFDAQGAGAVLLSWERDDSWDSNNPGGLSLACKLVGYQTPYNALIEGDYEKCVVNEFDVTIIDDSNQEGVSDPLTDGTL